MEEPKEPTQTVTATSTTTTTPGAASMSDRIIILMLIVLALTLVEIAALGALNGKTVETMTALVGLAGNLLSGILGAMVPKRS